MVIHFYCHEEFLEMLEILNEKIDRLNRFYGSIFRRELQKNELNFTIVMKL